MKHCNFKLVKNKRNFILDGWGEEGNILRIFLWGVLGGIALFLNSPPEKNDIPGYLYRVNDD